MKKKDKFVILDFLNSRNEQKNRIFEYISIYFVINPIFNKYIRELCGEYLDVEDLELYKITGDEIFENRLREAITNKPETNLIKYKIKTPTNEEYIKSKFFTTIYEYETDIAISILNSSQVP